MNDRRSMGSALKLTPQVSKIGPEALAFIKSGVPAKEPNPHVQTVELKTETVTAPASVDTAAEVVPESKEPKAKRAQKAQAPRYLTNRIAVSITTRLEQRTADALRRAHLEQKLKNVRPATQQEIMKLAVQGRLKENGYLD